MKHILLTALFQARVLMSINHQHVMNIIKEWHLAHYSTNRGKTDQAVKRGGESIKPECMFAFTCKIEIADSWNLAGKCSTASVWILSSMS